MKRTIEMANHVVKSATAHNNYREAEPKFPSLTAEELNMLTRGHEIQDSLEVEGLKGKIRHRSEESHVSKRIKPDRESVRYQKAA